MHSASYKLNSESSTQPNNSFRPAPLGDAGSIQALEAMETLLKIVGAIAVGAIGYWFFLRRRYRIAADNLKEQLLNGIENYRRDDTTLSASVLALYPTHNAAFERFLISAPRSKHAKLRKLWRRYTEVHDFFQQFGVFGIAVAEMPHPDFEASQENIDAVSRKRKKQILIVVQGFIDEL